MAKKKLCSNKACKHHVSMHEYVAGEAKSPQTCRVPGCKCKRFDYGKGAKIDEHGNCPACGPEGCMAPENHAGSGPNLEPLATAVAGVKKRVQDWRRQPKSPEHKAKIQASQKKRAEERKKAQEDEEWAEWEAKYAGYREHFEFLRQEVIELINEREEAISYDRTFSEYDEARLSALRMALSAMKELSGSFHPAGFIKTEIP